MWHSGPLLAGGLIVIPVVLLLSAPLHGHIVLPRRPHSLQPTSQPVPSFRLAAPAGRGPAPFHVPLTDVLYAVLGVVLLAGIAACVIALRRRTEAEAAPLAGDASLADGQPGLRDAVESGRRALVQLDDARAAIIACYLAMEGSLAAAGAARTRADTPGESLARAVAGGLVHGAAAGQLTSLFYEARFSGHEMTGAQRGAAEVALRQLAADLSEAPAGGTAPGVPASGEAASSGGTSSGNASGRAGDRREWPGAEPLARRPARDLRRRGQRGRHRRGRLRAGWPGRDGAGRRAGRRLRAGLPAYPGPAAAAAARRHRISAAPTRQSPAQRWRPFRVTGAANPGWLMPRPRSALMRLACARQLEHLLASRLAERHGISLYDDPAAARRAFTGPAPAPRACGDWIDPARKAAAGPAPSRHVTSQVSPPHPGPPH